MALIFFGGIMTNKNELVLGAIESSNIDKIGYCEATHTLACRFKNSNELYIYQGVPVNIFTELTKAESQGSYFQKTIRPYYIHTKVVL